MNNYNKYDILEILSNLHVNHQALTHEGGTFFAQEQKTQLSEDQVKLQKDKFNLIIGLVTKIKNNADRLLTLLEETK